MRSLLHTLARLDAGDWTALGALAVSVVFAWRQWRFEQRQARLTELQIAEHESANRATLMEQIAEILSEEFGEARAVLSSGFSNRSTEELEEMLRQLRDVVRQSKGR